MIRIARLTDYGIALMTHLARRREEGCLTTRDLAAELGLPQPTASKLLKQLVRAGLLVSRRGSRGGYQLADAPDRITIARLIAALEGPIAMTECSMAGTESGCDFETICGVRGNWQWINGKVMEALESVTLADMCGAVEGSAVAQGRPSPQGGIPAGKP